MSYLDIVRFHFAGRFFSDPSTINNDSAHYNSAEFNRAVDWAPGMRSAGDPGDGWWNPEGANSFRFAEVKITGAVDSNGARLTPAGDGIFAFTLASRGRSSAKMVDLDPDQQLVSTIFGLRLALMDDAGRIAFEGSFEPAPFTDIWRRGLVGSGDEAASVYYQSIITVDSWVDLASSSLLRQLRDKARDSILSIKFSLDGYSMNKVSPQFATGRIIGTVGAGSAAEPRHFVAGRHFGDEVFDPGTAFPGFRPTTGVNYFVGRYDQQRKKVLLDLGNALPVTPAGGPPADIGRLSLGSVRGDGTVTEIAEIAYRTNRWLDETAGIVELPEGRILSDPESQIVEANQLCLIASRQGQTQLLSREPVQHVRADNFVARINPADEVSVRFHAARLGAPLANTAITLTLLIPEGDDARANFPARPLRVPPSITTDANGEAELRLVADDPGDPRFFYLEGGPRRVHVDGQVYRISYAIAGDVQPNPSNIVSVLVWNRFVADEPPTWHGSMKAVFEQYGNLYPWMAKFGPQLDLADYDQVAAAKDDILRVLKLSVADPRYMPVVRDLSKSRRDAMIRWLTDVGADGRPLLGAAAAAPLAANIATARPPGPVRASATGAAQPPERGGKTLAGERYRGARK
jgi:hypothetical protein